MYPLDKISRHTKTLNTPPDHRATFTAAGGTMRPNPPPCTVPLSDISNQPHPIARLQDPTPRHTRPTIDTNRPATSLANPPPATTPAPSRSRSAKALRFDTEMKPPQEAAIPPDSMAVSPKREPNLATPAAVRVPPTTARPTARRKGRLAMMQGGDESITATKPATVRFALPPETEEKAGAEPRLARAGSAVMTPHKTELNQAMERGPGTARKAAGTAGLPSGKGGATPFVLRRGPEAEINQLGARMRAMALEETGAQTDRVGTDGGNVGQRGVEADGECGGEDVMGHAGGAPLERNPMLLVLDAELQELPWESLPSLRSQRYLSLSLSLSPPPLCMSACVSISLYVGRLCPPHGHTLIFFPPFSLSPHVCV
jgi:hypothetical protein